MAGNQEIRVGVVGLSGIGRSHVETFNALEGARVVTVAENQPGKLRGGDRTGKEYAAEIGARFYEDGVRLIQDEEIDAVSLCVSPRWRLALLEAAAARKLPAFVEKPWACDLEQGQQLAALVRSAEAMVMLEFPLRYFPPIVELRALLYAGNLGKPFVVNADLCMPRIAAATHMMWDPQNGNGAINENTCHVLDTVCFLLGEPAVLHALGGNFHGVGAPLEDGALINIEFENGSVASVTGGALGAPGMGIRTWLNVYAEHGQGLVTGMGHMYDTLTWAPHGQRDTQHQQHWPNPPRILRYSAQAFLDGVRTGRQPDCGIKDGLRALALTKAVRESLATRGPVAVDNAYRKG